MSSSYEKDVIQDAKDLMIDKLDEIDDDEYTAYPCELASELLEEDWANGTLTFDSQEAYRYVMAHPLAAASTHSYLSEIETDINPFDDAEKFHLVMMEEICRTIMSKCPFIDAHWNDEVVLDADTRALIKNQIEHVSPDAVER